MQKSALRELYKTKRKSLTAVDLDLQSQSISSLFFEKFAVQGKTISLFLPIEKLHEINTFYIWEEALKQNARVSVPKMDAKNTHLSHYILENKAQLALNSWGIPEPKTGIKIPVSEIDFVLVPLLAIDTNGHRVGYGKGFYDQFLKACKPSCIFIGLSLFPTISPIEDVYSGDVALHACIEPSKITYFG